MPGLYIDWRTSECRLTSVNKNQPYSDFEVILCVVRDFTKHQEGMTGLVIEPIDVPLTGTFFLRDKIRSGVVDGIFEVLLREKAEKGILTQSPKVYDHQYGYIGSRYNSGGYIDDNRKVSLDYNISIINGRQLIKLESNTCLNVDSQIDIFLQRDEDGIDIPIPPFINYNRSPKHEDRFGIAFSVPMNHQYRVCVNKQLINWCEECFKFKTINLL